MAFSLIKQSRKIIKKTFVASLTSNKPPGCIFLPENKAVSGKKFYILIFCLCVSRLSVTNIPYFSTYLYAHIIINKLLHGCLVCAHSFVSNLSQLVNKNGTHSSTRK